MNFLKATLYRYLCLFVTLVSVSGLSAQDIHFSQFYNAPFQRSPALTGVFDGEMRFAVNYRSQWYDVPITYRTAYGGFDKRFARKGENPNFFSLGVVFNYDHAGDAKLSNMQLGLNGSYTHQLAKAHYLTAGLQLAGYQRAFSDDDLRFDDQYNGKFYDPTLPNNESFDKKSILYGDFSAGLNWHFKSKNIKQRSNGSDRHSRTNFDIGGGLFHINQPKRNFYDQDDFKYPMRFNFYGIGIFEIGTRLDLMLNFMGQYQNPYREHVMNGGLKFHFNDDLGQDFALGFGVGYRFNNGFNNGDAVIPYFQLNVKSWQFGLSYDLNISKFDVATGGLGGPEFSLIYIFKKPDGLPICPTCPTYL